jgi:hypothetical protein
MARLELQWRHHESHEGFNDRDDYLDFVIDGEPLRDVLRCGDNVTAFGGWFGPKSLFYEAAYFRALLLTNAPYLATGRCEFYVCPNCGDIDCGSITGQVGEIGDRVVWRDFALEVSYWNDDPSEMLNRDGYEHVGPFEFDRNQYREALLAWPLRPRSGETEEAQDD